MKNPVAVTKAEAQEMYRSGGNKVGLVKRLDCSWYNTCLDVADEQKWPQFTCNNCTAYEAMSADQRVLDFLALRVMDEAAKNYEEIGHANRRLGVKPGADAKVRLRVVKDQVGSKVNDGSGDEDQIGNRKDVALVEAFDAAGV